MTKNSRCSIIGLICVCIWPIVNCHAELLYIASGVNVPFTLPVDKLALNSCLPESFSISAGFTPLGSIGVELEGKLSNFKNNYQSNMLELSFLLENLMLNGIVKISVGPADILAGVGFSADAITEGNYLKLYRDIAYKGTATQGFLGIVLKMVDSFGIYCRVNRITNYTEQNGDKQDAPLGFTWYGEPVIRTHQHMISLGIKKALL